MKNKKKDDDSGFHDDPAYHRPCRDPSHNPPTHLFIPQGKIYIHICPSCGHRVVMRTPAVYL